MVHRRRIVFWLAGLVNFGVSASVATMSPFFPQEAKARGMSTTTASLVFGAYPLSALVTSALMTRLVPYLGPKNLFVAGTVAVGVGNVAFGLLVYVRDLQMFTIYCFIIRVLMGTGSGANITSTFTYVANTFTEKISLTLGLLEVFTSLGLCAGPALGGLLYEAGGYSMPFYAVGAFLLLLLPINLLAMPRIKGHSQKSISYCRAFTYLPVYVTLGAISMVTMVFAFLEATFAQQLADRFALSPRSIGLVFLLFAVCYGLSSPLFGRLSDVIGRHRLLMVGIALALGALPMVALSPPPLLSFIPSDVLWVTLLSMCLGSLAFAATIIPTFAVLCDLIKGRLGYPEDIQTDALVSSAFQTFFYVGCVVGAGSSGYLVDHLGYSNALAVVSAVILLWSIITIATAVALTCCCPETHRHQPLAAEDKAAAAAASVTAPLTSDISEDPEPCARPKSRPENLDLSQLSIRESGGYKAFLPEIGSLSPPPERVERVALSVAETDRFSEEGDSGGPLGVHLLGTRHSKLAGSRERLAGSRERLAGSRERLGASRERLRASRERLSGLLAPLRDGVLAERGGHGSRERVMTPEERAAAQEESRIAEMIKNADLQELQELLKSPVDSSPDTPPPW